MKNRNSSLQRNLHDLESEISIALSLPYDFDLPHHRQLSLSIQRKFLFLRNFLSAEIASNPRKPLHHSRYFESRLAELEAVFRRWEGDRKDFSCAAAEEDRADDDRSVCSCPESSTEDGGSREDEEEGSADWVSNVDGEFERAVEEDEEEDKRLVKDQAENVALGGIKDSPGKRGRDEVIQRKTKNPPPPPKRGKLSKAILVGAVFGMILASVMYWECFRGMHKGDHAVKIIPT